jgi:hypothetical protein
MQAPLKLHQRKGLITKLQQPAKLQLGLFPWHSRLPHLFVLPLAQLSLTQPPLNQPPFTKPPLTQLPFTQLPFTKQPLTQLPLSLQRI